MTLCPIKSINNHPTAKMRLKLSSNYNLSSDTPNPKTLEWCCDGDGGVAGGAHSRASQWDSAWLGQGNNINFNINLNEIISSSLHNIKILFPPFSTWKLTKLMFSITEKNVNKIN